MYSNEDNNARRHTLACPACVSEMDVFAADTVTVDICQIGCGGIWFDHRELQKVDEPDEADGEVLEQVLAGSLPVDEGVRRHCPVCRDTVMMRHWYSFKRIVEVDEIRRVVAMAANGSTLSSADLLPEIAQRWHARASSGATSAPQAPVVQIRLGQTLGDAISQLEQEFIERAMIASGGRFTEAAKLLGVSRKGLFLKRRRQQAAAARQS